MAVLRSVWRSVGDDGGEGNVLKMTNFSLRITSVRGAMNSSFFCSFFRIFWQRLNLFIFFFYFFTRETLKLSNFIIHV